MPKSGLPSEKLTYYDAFMSIPANPFVKRGVVGIWECRLNPRTIMDRPSDHGYAAQRLDERRAEGALASGALSAQAEWKVLQIVPTRSKFDRQADPDQNCFDPVCADEGQSIRFSARRRGDHGGRPAPVRPPDCACRPAVTAAGEFRRLAAPEGTQSSTSTISTKRCRPFAGM